MKTENRLFSLVKIKRIDLYKRALWNKLLMLCVIKLVSSDWSSGSLGSLIRGKFNLKINQSAKTPRRKYRAVVHS